MPTLLSSLTTAELLSLRQLTQSSSNAGFLRKTAQAVTGESEVTAKPHPRQAEFLALDCEEALYGGAAGGGKTKALLMWLAEGVHIPGYSGIFFRRTSPQLSRSNDSAIEQSFPIYQPLGGKFNSQKHQWRFPCGALIEMSHMQYELNKFDHRGPSYHRICFDELTEFVETQYIYLRSRLRKHDGFPLTIGMRVASNPDGLGRMWVMKRFITQQAIDSIKQLTAFDPSPPGQVFWTPTGHAFMPSRVADNPTLDTDDYINRLQGLGAVLAARLANGDWSITEGSLIDPEWLRYFAMRGEMLVPIGKDDKQLCSVDSRTVQRFATIDTAGTSKHKADEDRGKPHSWSVCAIWDYWPKMRFLFLRHVWRRRVEWLDLKAGMSEVLRQWNVPLAVIESAHHGQPLAGELEGRNRVPRVCNAKLVNPVIAGMKMAKVGNALSAKQERAEASGFLAMLQQGRIFFPQIEAMPKDINWLPDFEGELLGWSGRKEETSDQVDVCSYAANHIRSGAKSWGGVVNARAGSSRW